MDVDVENYDKIGKYKSLKITTCFKWFLKFKDIYQWLSGPIFQNEFKMSS